MQLPFDRIPGVTVILPAGKFWPAEEDHQKYYLKNTMAYVIYRFHFRSGLLQAAHLGSGQVRI